MTSFPQMLIVGELSLLSGKPVPTKAACIPPPGLVAEGEIEVTVRAIV